MDLPVERCDRTGDIHTGGYPDILGNRVERYSHSGLEETLPDLRQERRGHGQGWEEGISNIYEISGGGRL